MKLWRHIAAICVLVAGVGGGALPQEETAAILRGTVTDYTGARFPKVLVRVSTDGHADSMETLSNGDYVFKLPPGTYEIRVTCPGCSGGRRGMFNLKPGAEIEFDFELVIAPFIDTIYVWPADEPPPPPRLRSDLYNSEELGAVATGSLRPLVLFGKRDGQDDVTTYSGPFVMDRQLPPVYTYDLLTIKADTLTYSRKDNSVHGTGHVVWHDGKTAKHGPSIDLTFRDGKPHVELAQ